MSFFLFFLLFSVSSSFSHVKDESNDETLFTAIDATLEDLEYLPSVGNGHVATVVYSDVVFMNDLYNGKRGNSHRAKIPSGNKIRVYFPPGEAASDNANTQINGEWTLQQHNFTLDVASAVFIESWDLTLSQNETQTQEGHIRIEQKTFAHRYFSKLIVTQIQVISSGSDSVNGPHEFTLHLSSDSNVVVEDLNEVASGVYRETPLKQVRFWCAEIQAKEDERYSDKILSTVCTLRNHVPSTVVINLNNEGPPTTITFIAGYGSRLEDINDDFNTVAGMILVKEHDKILALHVASWQNEFWLGDRKQPVIKVEGSKSLSKVINGCLYYILSNLPSQAYTTDNTNSYGLSPSGLAYGSNGTDYQGHTFWDTETWVFPPILYFYPEQAKQLLNYRLARVQAAWNRAKETGYKGARFPWESASTGGEVSPDDFSAGAESQIHITSDVSYAVRQYISMTRDMAWLKDRQVGYPTNGCKLLRDIAEFWASRATYNISTGYHDIRNVMSPDEDHFHGDNNGFTNVGAGYSIFYAEYAHCLCGTSSDPIPTSWLDIAKSLASTYDKERDYHPEYEGYQFGTPIKQADVILMGYPLMYEMNRNTRRNDIEAYTAVSRKNGPAMTWSMHSIAFLEVDEILKAEKMFNQSYQWHTKEPFHLWMEWLPERVPPTKFQPAVNFITGMGGFLQSIVNGYGGLRVYPEKLVLNRPRLPPGSTGLSFKGLTFLGNVLDIKISESFVKLWIRQSFRRYPLQVAENNQNPVPFLRGSLNFYLDSGNKQFPIEISTKTPTNCALPLDKIGIPIRTNQSSSTNNTQNEDAYVKWWKSFKPTLRHKIGEIYPTGVPTRSYDATGCSVPFYMKPKLINDNKF